MLILSFFNSKNIMKYKGRLLTGFTVIEFLIYIVILAIAMAGIGLILSNIFRVGTRTDVIGEVSHNGRFAMQRISQVIKESSVITIEEEGNQLRLYSKDGSSTIFYVFENDNGIKILRIKEGDQDADLTTERVNVDKLLFKKVAEDSVRVEMNISFSNPQHLPEYEFNSFFTSSFTRK